PASNQRPPCAAGCSRAQGPSGASPARSSARRTPGATDNTSPRSRRSGGLRPPCSAPARPEHRPAAASQRSLQACIASLPLQSSWMSKTYLKSDHFNGGGSGQRSEMAESLLDALEGSLRILEKHRIFLLSRSVNRPSKGIIQAPRPRGDSNPGRDLPRRNGDGRDW